MGIERMLSAVGNRLEPNPVSLVYVAHLPGFESQAQVLGEQLRSVGLATECDLLNRSLKAQLREAGKAARFTVIIGGQEWERAMVQIKDLTAGRQELVAVQDLAGYLLNQVRNPVKNSGGGANL
jgi:histidyl-tRNA synthetase